MKKFLEFFKKKRKLNETEKNLYEFKLKFQKFQSLLSINNEVLDIMTNLEKLKGMNYLFILEDLRFQVSLLGDKTYQLIKNLNKLCDNKYVELFDKLNEILNNINEKVIYKNLPYTLSFKDITPETIGLVGYKNYHLAELKQLEIPVPDGFAITTYGYEKFINYEGLYSKVNAILQKIDSEDIEESLKLSNELQTLIQKQLILPELEEKIFSSYKELINSDKSDEIKLAIRSSSLREDSEDTSFAGQYLSVLNVSFSNILDAYKKVIASKYNLNAIFYQNNMGLKGFDIPMAVCCIKMIDAKASGVLYTTNPIKKTNEENCMIIEAIWGLGEYLVEGHESSDHYIISKRDFNISSKKISVQNKMLVCSKNGGVEEKEVSEEIKNKQKLTDEQIITLSKYADTIENYYKKPQDIEWVLDQNDNLFIVQTRPLGVRTNIKISEREFIKNLNYDILIDKGDIIVPGIVSGKAYPVKTNYDLFNFPNGGILLIEKSSPLYSVLLKKARGVITDTGGITGHLASVIRQFNIPAIFNTENATKIIKKGDSITIDAYNGIIFKGEVKELIDEKEKEEKIKIKEEESNHFHKTLSEVLNFIVPLNLVDPRSDNFKSCNCLTIHDITRFSHEVAVKTMFRISNDKNSKKIGSAFKLEVDIPLNIYVINLGDGIKENEEIKNHKIKLEQIVSLSMLAILKGMLRDDLRWAGHTNIDFHGFLSVLAQTAISPQDYSKPLGDGSFFAISKNYMNFNSRLAYHFSIIDSYCSEFTNNNYIIFRFKGGADSLV